MNHFLQDTVRKSLSEFGQRAINASWISHALDSLLLPMWNQAMFVYMYAYKWSHAHKPKRRGLMLCTSGFILYFTGSYSGPMTPPTWLNGFRQINIWVCNALYFCVSILSVPLLTKQANSFKIVKTQWRSFSVYTLMQAHILFQECEEKIPPWLLQMDTHFHTWPALCHVPSPSGSLDLPAAQAVWLGSTYRCAENSTQEVVECVSTVYVRKRKEATLQILYVLCSNS